MAADDAQQTDNSEEKKSGGGKKLIMLIVIGLILIGASVGGTIAVLKATQPPPAPVESADGDNAADAEAPQRPAIYYPLKPEYILNIDARGRRRYLRLDLTVMTREEDVIAAIELHRPSVDHTINLIAGGQIFEEVQTAEGKELLRLQLMQELQALFEKEIGKPGIEQVLFTNFVMQ